MIVSKSIRLKAVMEFAGFHIIWLVAWMSLVSAVYHFTRWQWMSIPWLPMSVIGTAVAFYVGFKNNQSYDRLWEGRKIWGGIVNSSRMWGSMVKAYVNNDKLREEDVYAIKQQLIYRHIVWLYTLREQLLIPTQWEHVSLARQFGSINRKRRTRYGKDAFEQGLIHEMLTKYMPADELNNYNHFANAATQIMDKQIQELARLNREGSLDYFKQIELQKILNDFYDSQGKAERIKKSPLPRQYGSFSFIFVCIFIFLLPFGIVGEFNKLGEIGIWFAVPFGSLVGWVYVVMELIGDYSENPFEGLPNDVPMLSLCRTIEIDMLQQLGEEHVPDPIAPINNVLM